VRLTPTTKESLNSDSKNVFFLAIVICIKALSASMFLLVGFKFSKMLSLMRIFFLLLNSILMPVLNSDLKFCSYHPQLYNGVNIMDEPVANFPNCNSPKSSVHDGVQVAILPCAENDENLALEETASPANAVSVQVPAHASARATVLEMEPLQLSPSRTGTQLSGTMAQSSAPRAGLCWD
jgi:hypothetical protein